MSLPEQATRSAYDAVADLYADHIRGTEPEQDVDLAMIRHFAALLAAPGRVLDAGCGAGRMLPVLAGLGLSTAGVDLSPGMVRRAQADHPGFDVRVGSLADLAWPDASFEGVFSWYSTIHTPDADLPRILAEARRVLVPGGHLLLALQTGQGRHEVGEAYRRLGVDVTLHRYARTPDAVVAALEAAEFEVVARLERAACGQERAGQAVLVARAGVTPGPGSTPTRR